MKKPIEIICVNTGQVFKSIGEAARRLGVERCNISAQLLGKKMTVNGYIFKRITGSETSEELKQICLDSIRDDFKMTLPLTVGDECDG